MSKRACAAAVFLVLIAAACEYDPAEINGPLSQCNGQVADLGFGFNGNEDPAEGKTHFGTTASDVIVVANGPVGVIAGAGHDVICADPLNLGGAEIVIDGGPGLDDCRNVGAASVVNCEFIDGVPNIDAVNETLGRGLNFGNLLEAPREGDWGLEYDAAFFSIVAAEGFEHIRVPISWGGYAAATAPYTIPTDNDPTVVHPDYDSIFERVDWIIEQADANGLIAIINMHHDDAIHTDPVGQTPRFLAMWDQIATRYADAGNHVLFELFNEPHAEFDDNPALWNTLAADGLAVIRQSNPTRPVLIGPVGYNSIDRLDDLALPADPYLITSIHFYDPFPFTHQGATWIDPPQPTGVSWDADLMGFGPAVGNVSWSTTVTSATDELLVEYGGQWTGFAVDFSDTIDPTSLTFDVAGAASMRVVCRDPQGTETDIAIVDTTTGAAAYTLDATACPTNTNGIFFQNVAPTAELLRFTDLDICSTSCDDVIATAAQAIHLSMEQAAQWGAANGRPMHVGEFGAFGAGGAADLGDRAAWTATVQNAARSRGLSTSYWEFGAGFGVYDPATGQWITPLLDALLN